MGNNTKKSGRYALGISLAALGLSLLSMKLSKIQGPRVHKNRTNRAAASFVDQWQVRLFAVGPYYLRLSKRPVFDDKTANEVATAFTTSPELIHLTYVINGEES